ncbi:MAG: response regulator [Planctomycetota bacterium]
MSTLMSEAKLALPTTAIVVDDEHLVAQGIASAVRSLGIDVLGVEPDSERALQSIEDTAPAIALLDIRMPGEDGLELAKRLWMSNAIPSVIITAYAAAEYLERAQQPGVFGYALKPVVEEQLLVSLSIAWSRYAATLDDANRVIQLETSLANRRIVESAKWLLVAEHAMSEPSAHSWLQQRARSTRRPIAEVAEDVIEKREIPETMARDT